MQRTKWKWDADVPPHFTEFADTMADLDILLESHVNHFMAGAAEGEIRDEVENVYIRSAVLLLCSSWEAYVEDLLTAAVAFLVSKTDDPTRLPKTLRKSVVRMLESEKHELAAWGLAGGGWKVIVRNLLEQRVSSLHSPKSSKIAELYREFLDIDILSCWNWTWSSDKLAIHDVEFDCTNTIYFIDHMVSVRGCVAHGRATDQPLTSFLLMNYGLRIYKLVALMHSAVADRLESITDHSPWRKFSANIDFFPILKAEPAATEYIDEKNVGLKPPTVRFEL